MKKNNKNRLTSFLNYGIVIAAFAVCQFMISSGAMTRSLKGQLIPICCYIVMAVSLNLTVGFSGELSLGHAGFMSVGAFSGIVMAQWLAGGMGMQNETMTLVFALVCGGVCAGIAGVIIGIPVLRLRGDYLAIVTLAFGEIIRNVLNCLYISLDGTIIHIAFNNPAIAGTMLVNGPMGATGVKKISTFTAGFVLILFTLFVIQNLVNSRSGRAIMAIRDNRIAAESVGISITKYKMMAFVTSAVLAGMAGALYGLNFSTVAAAKFKFDTSILVLVFVVLGGIGNITGSIISAALLTVLPELLRSFADYRMLIYAIVLIVVMLATNNPVLMNAITGVKEKITGRKSDGKEGE